MIEPNNPLNFLPALEEALSKARNLQDDLFWLGGKRKPDGLTREALFIVENIKESISRLNDQIDDLNDIYSEALDDDYEDIYDFFGGSENE